MSVISIPAVGGLESILAPVAAAAEFAAADM
jgi:hypothetical protein